jgi:hypothetical protein
MSFPSDAELTISIYVEPDVAKVFLGSVGE